MKKVFKIFMISILLFLFNHTTLYSQYDFKTIKADYAKGNLTYQQYLEYSALNLFVPDKVPQQYRVSVEELPLKSGTFLIQEIKTHWNELSLQCQQILAKYLSRPELSYSILSQSKIFRIHYTTEGYDAVRRTDSDSNGIPDYAEKAAEYLDYAYHLLVDSLGYIAHAPDSSGQGKEFDVYLIQISGAYGMTYLEENVSGKSSSYSCYMTVENDFAGFQTPALRALRVTTADEYYHTIQVHYTYRDEYVFFMEMCSTWMEDFAQDDANEYLLYMDDFFYRPN